MHLQRVQPTSSGFSGHFFLLFFLLCCCYMCPGAVCVDYAWPLLKVNSIWKSFLKYKYFRKDFQMLLPVKEDEIWPPQCALGHI